MYSIFILGAGFSKPAGMPLGDEFFELILKEAKKTILYKNILKRDIERFLEYYNKINCSSITENEINFEEFISYLDIEHYLALKGKNTWTIEVNRSQLVIRNLIAKILYQKMSLMKKSDYDLYNTFAENLDPGDIIITFNYDTIIERCLERKNKLYRLFLDRFSSVSHDGGIIDDSKKEVILLKMHGSIDWFDIEKYDTSYDYYKQNDYFQLPKHAIFSNQHTFMPMKIINGPYFKDSLLNRIYRVNNLKKYFEQRNFVTESPLILSPSFNKIVYLNPLKEFWYSFYSAGSLNQKVVIIGFSLPEHDDYIKQPMFTLIDNFQNYDPKVSTFKKSKLKVVDYRRNNDEIQKFKDRYSFVKWDNTKCYFDGFDRRAVEIIFEKN